MATEITTLPDEGVLVSDNVREVTTIKMTQSSLPLDADEDDIFFTETVWYNVIVLCVNILAIFLNGIVIYIVARYREMRNTVTLCFVNLAITDITLVLSQMTGPLRRITGFDVNKIFGCGNVYYLHVVTIFATGMTMTFLAFDRYRIISKPLESIKNRTSLKIMLSFVAIWLLSFAVYFYIPLVHVDVGTHCTNRYKNVDQAVGDKLFHTSKALMHYFIPIVLAGFFYMRIYIIIRRSMVPGDAFSTTTVGKGDQASEIVAFVVSESPHWFSYSIWFASCHQRSSVCGGPGTPPFQGTSFTFIIWQLGFSLR
ncbi:putative octopamine receptor beta-2R [Apostichopus japonicus]|uniref:Putative octopamine receptor beta-2R n=1 Tax=Stichopus japonicus TaxID=307972 RepID=A0A2G8L8W8_STIJA|nr:putative octopamine receptor beta-2R [Apostichopus japonicus]